MTTFHRIFIAALACCLASLGAVHAEDKGPTNTWDRMVTSYAEEAAAKAKDEKKRFDAKEYIQQFLKEKDIPVGKVLGKAIVEKFTVLVKTDIVKKQLETDGVPEKSGFYDELFQERLKDLTDKIKADPDSVRPLDPDKPPPFGSDSTNILKGLGFGLGLSVTLDIGTHDRVKRATKDADGFLRIEEEHDVIPRFVLESHYFFPTKHSFLGVNGGNWGYGPFVAVEPGGDSVINAIGGGLMLGFKRRKAGLQFPESFNLAVGVIVDPSVQILGDGLVPNQKLGPTQQVRFKETHQVGIMLLFSAGF